MKHLLGVGLKKTLALEHKMYEINYCNAVNTKVLETIQLQVQA